MNKLPFRSNSGQVLLVTLLIMAVVLTIGLSLISRSITDVRISKQTEDAARAYSAAEAGIEAALIGGTNETFIFSETGAKYSLDVAGLGEGGTEYVFPQKVSVNEIQTFWMADASDLSQVYNRNKLRVVWGNEGNGLISDQDPALEVSIYYLDGTTYKVGRFTLDPYSSRSPDPSFCNPGEIGLSQCQSIDNFSVSNETVGGKNFRFGSDLNLSAAGIYGGGKTALFARLRIYYSGTSQIIGVKAVGGGSGSFSAQGTKIESTGQSGQSTRKVVVVRANPAPPEIFDFVLYSGGDLVK
ncbi:MAG: hypothetical protein Q8Q15_02785 [bacterium]|nr:hypothetical protein [bacterium]